MNELSAARIEINDIDAQLRVLFEQRMHTAAKIAQYKKANDLPVLDTAREDEVIKRNVDALCDDSLRTLYDAFVRNNMALSRAYQAQILCENVVAFQGVNGAFSHIALKALFPFAQTLSVLSFKEVFDAVETSKAKYGILPLENSFAGDVSEVLDLCFERALNVVNVYDLPVTHNLLSVKGAKLSDIDKVYSHSQAISQCSRFLQSLNVKTYPYPNTALAAKYVADSNDITIGAIASAETAALYELDILATDINTSVHNTTRFIVISKERLHSGNRFSLLFTVEHKAGSLAAVVETIGSMGFNLECIKSRPMPDLAWQYYFYAEIIGSSKLANELVSSLSSICKTVRILGVYQK